MLVINDQISEKIKNNITIFFNDLSKLDTMLCSIENLTFKNNNTVDMSHLIKLQVNNMNAFVDKIINNLNQIYIKLIKPVNNFINYNYLNDNYLTYNKKDKINYLINIINNDVNDNNLKINDLEIIHKKINNFPVLKNNDNFEHDHKNLLDNLIKNKTDTELNLNKINEQINNYKNNFKLIHINKNDCIYQLKEPLFHYNFELKKESFITIEFDIFNYHDEDVEINLNLLDDYGAKLFGLYQTAYNKIIKAKTKATVGFYVTDSEKIKLWQGKYRVTVKSEKKLKFKVKNENHENINIDTNNDICIMSIMSIM